jgi:hypothetical protein
LLYHCSQQPTYPHQPTDGWLKKIHVTPIYAIIKKNKIMSFEEKLMELEIILSKISQTQKENSASFLS